MIFLYHLSKGNVVVDDHSRLSMGSVAHFEEDKNMTVRDVHRFDQLGVRLVDSNVGGVVVRNGSKSSFVLDVRAKQSLDPVFVKLKKVVLKNYVVAFYQRGDGVLFILRSFEVYWWNGMKKDNAEFVTKCPSYQKVKVEHQKIEVSYSIEDYVKLYLKKLVRLYGVPLFITSDHGTKFTSEILKSFQKGLGSHVKLSMTFHPQIVGQIERTIQTLEDMVTSL
ncbi:hypothetical protein MTR67_002130 [Solanum verrucosum]|uniref:Integrase catalytic domain-containing protein n=1 Tax=Solanum verrucosum TaxID=315347 RepID=A0AAF0PT36_SOLVR|nr:hypothetical protein MTR67_002130 [Solanum verrucosum]